ncbi:hypothetical protein [Candidatus Parabeggiatoa sp. HSG14]|uniref:hypothetical protein n=1 Tax=Candidatus Parabeggiatoa sp. HSG14 TaxID=3055593 RepID=UPI0025A90832|nr:hypothetical protein [Thiotrichales bacterium HSG14]
MQKILQFILISVVVVFFGGCAITPVSNVPEHCSEEKTLPASKTSCDCDNDDTISQMTVLKDKNKMLKKRLNEANEQLVAFKLREIRVANKTPEVNQESLEKLRTQLEKTQERLDTLTAQNDKFKDKVAKLIKEDEKNQAKIKALHTDKKKLINKVKQLEQQLSEKMPTAENYPVQDGSSGKIYRFKDK